MGAYIHGGVIFKGGWLIIQRIGSSLTHASPESFQKSQDNQNETTPLHTIVHQEVSSLQFAEH